MRYTVAVDSYKGSLSSAEAAAAIREGLLRGDPNAVVRCIPIADGGEGTVEAYLAACGGSRRILTVTGPLSSPVEASYALLPDGIAVIEMAAAAGLPLVPPDRRDPKVTTTRGVGELITDALNRGVRRFILGIGGSATNDGGTGMLRALGWRFMDGAGKPLPEGGAVLTNLAVLDNSNADPRLREASFCTACDVTNPLCGERGASAVFAPQKGAAPADVALLDAALSRFADLTARTLGTDLRNVPGTGAAGGLGFALKAFLNAELRPGVSLLLDTAGFDRLLADTDAVITGEGATDLQTVYGKAPVGISRRAAARGIPTFILSGGLGKGYEVVYQEGVTAAYSIAPGPVTLDYAMEHARELLTAAAEALARTISVFRP